jgi:hypothetical protein
LGYWKRGDDCTASLRGGGGIAGAANQAGIENTAAYWRRLLKIGGMNAFRHTGSMFPDHCGLVATAPRGSQMPESDVKEQDLS